MTGTIPIHRHRAEAWARPPEPKCPICSGEDFLPVATIDTGLWRRDGGNLERECWEVEIGECRTCGHAMVLTPYTEAFVTQIYRSDPSLAGVSTAFGDASVITYCAPELAAAKPGLHVDFGCGSGHLAMLLNRDIGVAAQSIVGLDFHGNPPSVGRYIRADLDNLDDETLNDLVGQVSFAYATQVLEHLRDPRGFLIAVRRVLRPDGFLYIDVPPFSRGPVGGIDHPVVGPQHIQYFSADRLAALAEACGFGVLRVGEPDCLRILLRPLSAPPTIRPDRAFGPGSGAAVRTTLADYAERRRTAAGRVLAALQNATGPVALWGLGSEFARLLESDDRFRNAALDDPRLMLFDLSLAGLRLGGKTISNPQALAGFTGPVVRLPPYLPSIRAMVAFADSIGLKPERLIDPWA